MVCRQAQPSRAESFDSVRFQGLGAFFSQDLWERVRLVRLEGYALAAYLGQVQADIWA
jgi:hypothetical protein